jgi:hypothetical protein
MRLEPTTEPFTVTSEPFAWAGASSAMAEMTAGYAMPSTIVSTIIALMATQYCLVVPRTVVMIFP